MWIAIGNAIGSRQPVGGGAPPDPGYTPPLDTYTGATAAYSVRKLSSSYSGSCIEAYRVSDGATQDIGFDSSGLIDTAAIVAFGGASEVRVSRWYDQSGNALDAVQTASANMARIYDGSSIYEDNGNPAVDFNNNQFFSVGSSQWTDGAMMASIVFSRRSGNDTYWTSSGSVWRLFYESATHGFIHYGTTPVSTRNLAPPGSAPVLTTARFGQGSADLYENGISVGSSPTVTGSMSTASVPAFMAQRSDGSLRMDGTIQELIHWGSDQTDNRTGVESNINEYYQITNLPATTGFLADYPGAAAAYSVRSLSNNAIKCMRVRQSVPPYAEQDIGFTSTGDLDEQAIIDFGGANPLTVAAWYDQSGQSRHATQITPGSQPQIYDGASVVTENGKPGVQFVDGVAQSMTINYNISNTALSAFTVMRKSSTAGRATGIQTTTSAPYRDGWVIACDNTVVSAWYDTDGASGYDRVEVASDGNVQNLSSLIATAPNIDFRLNGGTSATKSNLFASTDPLNIHQWYSNQGAIIQEIIVYDDAKNATDRTGIETNIMTYYSIP